MENEMLWQAFVAGLAADMSIEAAFNQAMEAVDYFHGAIADLPDEENE